MAGTVALAVNERGGISLVVALNVKFCAGVLGARLFVAEIVNVSVDESGETLGVSL